MTELKPSIHSVQPRRECIEVWHDGVFVASIYPADSCGIRIVSKHPTTFVERDVMPSLNVVEVLIDPKVIGRPS